MKHAEVVEYLSLHAAAAIAEKRMGELKETLLPALRAGELSPTDLSHLLVLRKSERTEKDYRTPLLARLVAHFGRKVGQHKLELIEAKFGTKEIESLHVVQNKQLAAQQALAELAA